MSFPLLDKLFVRNHIYYFRELVYEREHTDGSRNAVFITNSEQF